MQFKSWVLIVAATTILEGCRERKSSKKRGGSDLVVETPVPSDRVEPEYVDDFFARHRDSVVDFHTHVACIEEDGSGCFISESMKKQWRFPFFMKAFNTTYEEAVQKGSAYFVDQVANDIKSANKVQGAVVFALDGYYDDNGVMDKEITRVYVDNEFVFRTIRKYDFLTMAASIHPNRPDAIEQLRLWARRGVRIVKWLPAIQGIDPSRSRYLEYYKTMKELGLVLVTHAGNEYAFSDAEHDLGDPDLLELPLDQGVTIIAAHAGAAGFSGVRTNFSKMKEMLAKYPNLYVDVSSLTQANRLGRLNDIFDAPEFKDKVIYGSDFPLINTVLVDPVFFTFRIQFADILKIRKVPSLLDQDYLIKAEMGMQDADFRRKPAVLMR